MGQKFTQVPADTFQKLQLNAGILTDGFTPNTGSLGTASILGATSGGINFATNPTYVDFGEDVDNVPANTKELKHLQSFDPVMSGTFLTCTPDLADMLVGPADTSSNHVVPRSKLETADFKDIWWIGDYSNINSDATASGTGGTDGTAGFIAIHLMNALNTSGFQIQSTKDSKGTFSFEFHGHYSIDSQDTVPFEIYVKSGTTPVAGT